MRSLITLLFLLLTSNAQAWTLGVLDYTNLEVEKYSCHREPMTPQIPCEDYKGAVRLKFKVGLLNDLIKWENNVHGEGTDAKFTTLGWEYYVSIPTPWGIEPFLHHHSQHTLDMDQPTYAGQLKPAKFPVTDGIGIRFTFYERVKKR